MPTKPKTESWQTSAPPQTLLQQNAFIDSCTAWLTEQQTSRPEEAFECRTVCPDKALVEEPTGDAAGRWTVPHLSFTPLELRVTSRHQPCFFCGSAPLPGTQEAPRRAVMANPFAQRHFVIVCDACRG